MGQRFTQAQVDLALRKEQLILRVERGESLEAVSQDLGLAYHPEHVSRLRRRYIAGGRHWVALVDGREGRATKITAEIVKWIITELQRDPELTATSVHRQIREVFQVEVSGSHVRQLVLNLGHAGRRGLVGRARWSRSPRRRSVWADRVEVVLEPYRYAHLQQAAEESCKLFNAASLKDEHGRYVTMRVTASEQEFVNLGGAPIRTRQG